MQDDLTIEQILEWPEMADVIEELESIKFLTRQHGSRATAAVGCNGPLCRKAERDRQRERNEEKATAAGRTYVPRQRLWDRDELIDAIIEWHKNQLTEGRQERAV